MQAYGIHIMDYQIATGYMLQVSVVRCQFLFCRGVLLEEQFRMGNSLLKSLTISGAETSSSAIISFLLDSY